MDVIIHKHKSSLETLVLLKVVKGSCNQEDVVNVFSEAGFINI